MACPACSGREKSGRVRHDGSLEYYTGMNSVGFVEYMMKMAASEMSKVQRSGEQSTAAPRSGHNQLRILKYPSSKSIIIYDPATHRYERLRDYGDIEVLSGNTGTLGEFFQKFGGTRRGLLDYNMMGQGLPSYTGQAPIENK